MPCHQKRMKKISTRGLRRKAWTIFSKYIRRKYSDHVGYCYCVTCGKHQKWQQMDAGHAIGGRRNSVLFQEDLVRPQCRYCNRYQGGKPLEFREALIREYGEKRFEYLRALAKRPKFYTREQYQGLIFFYGKKVVLT